MAVNRINQGLSVVCARRLMSRLGFTPDVLWLYNPEQGSLIGRFGARLRVYHCIDEFAAGTSGRKRRTIVALEAQLLSRVDLVFANSTLTYERKRTLHPETHRVPSGADVKHFSQTLDAAHRVHPKMADLRHPIAGYVGNINAKVDVDLLLEVANRLANWQFVFVGQAYPQAVDLRPLSRLCNVHFLGRVPFAEVPSLMGGMDVCLVPYVSTEDARYRSPLKLYEYLAAGRPVVSTDHPEARELSAWVEIASGAAQYAESIVRAWEQDSPEKRRQRALAAREHSWDRRVDKMERHVLACLGGARVE
jgi:glycosyltransferase involved in cell wall biosynthesis